jgi:hypothetical protein
MHLENSSATAYAPPPIVHYPFEPAGRRGGGSSPDVRSWGVVLPKANTSASTAKIEEKLYLELASERSPAALKKARMAAEISKRLRFLKIEAEIERIPFSEASLADFRGFIRETGPRVRPALFLNDNGNLRALWKNDRREQIGLQFLGEGSIQFVIFKQRRSSIAMARVAGIDAKDKILGHIRASGAEELLFG